MRPNLANFDENDLNRMLGLARVKLPGVSLGVLKAELYDVLHEFFKDTSSWTVDIPFQTQDNKLDYDLNDNFAAPLGLIEKLSGVVDTLNISQAATMRDPGIVTLRDQPTAGQTFAATFVMNVSLPLDRDNYVPEFPDFVLKLWAPGILSGLLWKLKSQDAKSWTDPRGAATEFRQFQNAKNAARAAALHQNSFGRNTWLYPQGFKTRGQRGGVSVGNAKFF